ncbi:MAG TPA: HAD family hydrolase [Candidatus Fimivicinus intestinavium]|nr:HAD family hydrolase [Candidatus Fimivicinus intestinavium]
MKTLYVSDLDGTLLNCQSRLSAHTVETLNRLIEEGLPFTYATARSVHSARVVADGLQTRLPVITYNGVFLQDAQTGKVLSSTVFSPEEIGNLAGHLSRHPVSALAYALLDGEERVSWLPERENEGVRYYLSCRKGDKRFRAVSVEPALYQGAVFYITCIGGREELMPLYDAVRGDTRFSVTFQQELYREEYWLEIMPAGATKAQGIRRLCALLGFDRVVSFGDAVNDLRMFDVSDECYAVENAVPELKAAATGVIQSNEADGVAKWLESHWVRP